MSVSNSPGWVTRCYLWSSWYLPSSAPPKSYLSHPPGSSPWLMLLVDEITNGAIISDQTAKLLPRQFLNHYSLFKLLETKYKPILSPWIVIYLICTWYCSRTISCTERRALWEKHCSVKMRRQSYAALMKNEPSLHFFFLKYIPHVTFHSIMKTWAEM